MPLYPMGPPTKALVDNGYWTFLNFDGVCWEYEAPEHIAAWMCQFIMLELFYTYVWKAEQKQQAK